MLHLMKGNSSRWKNRKYVYTVNPITMFCRVNSSHNASVIQHIIEGVGTDKYSKDLIQSTNYFMSPKFDFGSFRRL